MEQLPSLSDREEGVVEIESHWIATRRENQGIYPTVRRRDPA
jgi:hypothetical protein